MSMFRIVRMFRYMDAHLAYAFAFFFTIFCVLQVVERIRYEQDCFWDPACSFLSKHGWHDECVAWLQKDQKLGLLRFQLP